VEGAKSVRFERSYEATLQDLWYLWTTKKGFESWWGPEGFRVEVHVLEARPGGELNYDMIAVDPAHIKYLKKEGMAPSHGTRGTFEEVEPLRRLRILHVIDFIPGVAPYDNNIVVEFSAHGSTATMTVTIQAHIDKEWTKRSAMGFESQLRKVPAALAARRNSI
jgi:uncharacterized protein YndB with AHSA1/START domain